VFIVLVRRLDEPRRSARDEVKSDDWPGLEMSGNKRNESQSDQMRRFISAENAREASEKWFVSLTTDQFGGDRTRPGVFASANL
jgi:hypothetical protein